MSGLITGLILLICSLSRGKGKFFFTVLDSFWCQVKGYFIMIECRNYFFFIVEPLQFEVTLFLNEQEVICLHTVKWFQVLLSITNNTGPLAL